MLPLPSIPRRYIVRLLFAPAVVLISSFAAAQSAPPPPMAVTPALAAQHLKSSTPPGYPTMSTPFHLSGAVQLAVSIDTAGHVTQVKWIEPAAASLESTDPSSSPSLVNMLSSYAIAAVKTWTYAPFDHDGVPVPVTTTVAVPFDFAARSSSSGPVPGYDQSMQACYASANSNAATPQQLETCKAAADAADKLPANALERVSVYTVAAGAVSKDKQFHEALKYANKAIDSAKQGHENGIGASAAYAARASAEANLGLIEAADQDQSIAEEYLRDALKQMDETHVGEFNRGEYVHALKSMLDVHAQMLIAQGNTAAAQAKTDESAKLQ